MRAEKTEWKLPITHNATFPRFRLALFVQVLFVVTSLTSVTNANAGTDRKPIKSYEVEHAVFMLCHRADLLKNAGQYAQAITFYQQAALSDPTSYSSYIHADLADCYDRSGREDDAIRELQKVIRMEPNDGRAYYTLAQIYYQTGHYDTSSQYLRKIIKLSSDKEWVARAQDMLREVEPYGDSRAALDAIKGGHLEEARKLLSHAASHDPSRISASVHSNLAFVLRSQNKSEEALVEAKKSLQYDPNDKDTIYTIGICYQDIADFDQAISWLQQYLRLETDSKKRKEIEELISNLTADKIKANSSSSKAADYFDGAVEGPTIAKWELSRFPLKIFIASGNGVKGFRSRYPSFITAALDTWSHASGNKLSYVLVKDKSKADLTVDWISEPIMIEDFGKKRVKQGVAHTSSSGGVIDDVDVEVDMMNGYSREQMLEEGECASVCMHEIGHALGLHHSTNFYDMMYFGSSSKQTGELTNRDKRTIARLYEKYPVSSLAPPEQKPLSVKYLPPPSFVPPEPTSEKDLPLPTFLPPPIDDEELTPPFFMPAPSKDGAPSVVSGAKKPAATKVDSLPIPSFLPPPAVEAKSKSNSKSGNSQSKSGGSQSKSGSSDSKPGQSNSKGTKKDTQGSPSSLFFTPPPAK